MTTPDGEGAQSGAEGTQSGAGDNTGANNGGTDTSTSTGSSEGTQSGANQQGNSEAETLRAQLEQQREHKRQADRRAAELEGQLKQLRDKDLPEAEKLKRDFEETQKRVEKLQSTNQQLALQVAFLKDNTYTWHNPETALKLVDLSQVTIEEDGSVSGLKDALKALASSNDYLVKKEAAPPEAPPAGTAPGNNGGSSSKPSTKNLAARLPALNTRVRRG